MSCCSCAFCRQYEKQCTLFQFCMKLHWIIHCIIFLYSIAERIFYSHTEFGPESQFRKRNIRIASERRAVNIKLYTVILTVPKQKIVKQWKRFKTMIRFAVHLFPASCCWSRKYFFTRYNSVRIMNHRSAHINRSSTAPFVGYGFRFYYVLYLSIEVFVWDLFRCVCVCSVYTLHCTRVHGNVFICVPLKHIK